MFPSWKVSKCTLENRIVIYCSKNSLCGIGGSDAGDSNGTGECERRENPPGRGRPAAGVVQHPPGPSRALPPVPPPRHEGTGAAAGVRAVVPEGTDPPGDESESGGADPGGAAGADLRVGPPTPLYRAEGLGAGLDSPARIYVD